MISNSAFRLLFSSSFLLCFPFLAFFWSGRCVLNFIDWISRVVSFRGVVNGGDASLPSFLSVFFVSAVDVFVCVSLDWLAGSIP